MAQTRVTTLRQAGRDVRSSLEVNGNAIADQILEMLTPHLQEGEQPPDLRLLFRLLVRFLDSREGEMTKQDRLVDELVAALVGPREACKALSDEQRALLMRFRDVLVAIIGKERTVALGFDTYIDPVPETVLNVSGRVVHQLKKTGGAAITSDLEGIDTNPSAMLAQLEPGHEQLETKVGALKEDQRHTQNAQLDRQKAIDAYIFGLTWIARIAEAAFTFAGRKDLADRIRASRRSTTSAGEEDGGPDVTPPTDPPPDDPPPDDPPPTTPPGRPPGSEASG